MTITTATAKTIADARARAAAVADDLYAIDHDTLDVQSRIALTAAANGIREAEHALARLIGERPTRESGSAGKVGEPHPRGPPTGTTRRAKPPRAHCRLEGYDPDRKSSQTRI